MKKGVLILLGMFMMVSTVEAKNGNELPNRIGFSYSYNNAVNFVERGVEFFIFTNGEFDFNSHYNDTYYDYNGNRTRRESGINIDRDYRGRISRIGNSFINYDRNGNVTRIGNVFMRYYRGKLTNVGNLTVRYNYWGNPTFYGNVKNNYYNYNGFRINLNIGDIFNYNDAYFYRNDFRRNYFKIREDKNYYYYRANPNANIGKRSKTLRRRKPASTILKNSTKTNTRRGNTTYRKPTSVNSDRKVITEKRNTNSTTRRSNVNTNRNSVSKNKIEKSINRKPTTTNRSTKRKVDTKKTIERKRRS
ncbi:hypothetical protein [Polaribacter sp. Hel1_85]|uniref:hypothetical protein n=1 Tax=Polaribacter sp. Hel1_85 TaxID=1250005 RepID=UPI00052D0D4B|nr:hypothetical protein [Polaribacter sp. Hel1_85]KGL62933.1 hypothetical protein PHEL85_2729 [Polaribacter sp. Hel1_85]